jgi:hypothetical protein
MADSDVLFSTETETEEPETEEVVDEEEDDGTPPDIPEAKPMMGAATSTITDAKPEDPLYVPVTNVNYIPEGSPEYLEGYVPNTPGDDPTLLRIKAGLETQGHQSGPVEEPEPPVE